MKLKKPIKQLEIIDNQILIQPLPGHHSCHENPNQGKIGYSKGSEVYIPKFFKHSSAPLYYYLNPAIPNDLLIMIDCQMTLIESIVKCKNKAATCIII
jgi:hypothetical protein